MLYKSNLNKISMRNKKNTYIFKSKGEFLVKFNALRLLYLHFNF